MSLRETIREQKTWAALGGILLLGTAVVLIRLQFNDSEPGGATAPISSRAFFTVDDGNTWFIDSSKRIPPFDQGGSVAVRAYVFTCDGGKTKFTGYLERYTPKAKQLMEAIVDQPGDVASPPPGVIGGIEVKKPGGKEWIKVVDRTRAAEVCSVPCENGQAAAVEP